MPKIILDLKNYANPVGYRGKSNLVVFIWYLVANTVFRFSPRNANKYRVRILRLFGAQIDEGVLIRRTVKIEFPWKLKLGAYSWLGDNVTLYNQTKLSVGANSVISQNCYICTGTHDWRKPTFDLVLKPVNIGASVWIAADTFIGPGVDVGDNVLIGCRKTIMTSVATGTILK